MQSPTLLTHMGRTWTKSLPYKYGVILRTQYLIQPCRKLGGGPPAEPPQ